MSWHGDAFWTNVLLWGDPRVTSDYSHKRPIMWSFDAFFVVSWNKFLTRSSCYRRFVSPYHILYSVMSLSYSPNRITAESRHSMLLSNIITMSCVEQLRVLYVSSRSHLVALIYHWSVLMPYREMRNRVITRLNCILCLENEGIQLLNVDVYNINFAAYTLYYMNMNPTTTNCDNMAISFPGGGD